METAKWQRSEKKERERGKEEHIKKSRYDEWLDTISCQTDIYCDTLIVSNSEICGECKVDERNREKQSARYDAPSTCERKRHQICVCTETEPHCRRSETKATYKMSRFILHIWILNTQWSGCFVWWAVMAGSSFDSVFFSFGHCGHRSKINHNHHHRSIIKCALRCYYNLFIWHYAALNMTTVIPPSHSMPRTDAAIKTRAHDM